MPEVSVPQPAAAAAPAMVASSPSSSPSRGVPSQGTMEAVVAALIFGIGAVVISDSQRLGSGWAEDGPRAGYFPFRIGLILCACGLLIFVQALWRRRELAGNFIERHQVGPVLTVLVPTVGYVLAIQFLGIYVASALFVALFMVFVGKFTVWKSFFIGITMSLLAFWVFEHKFLVPLPKGPLETWLGY